jgi:hypothetical protein
MTHSDNNVRGKEGLEVSTARVRFHPESTHRTAGGAPILPDVTLVSSQMALRMVIQQASFPAEADKRPYSDMATFPHGDKSKRTREHGINNFN